MQDKHFYITTPLYYVTAAPHLGSLYSTVLADVCARWQVLNGRLVVFTTGTDEHGQKIAQAAEKAGKNPQAFVDEQAPLFEKAWQAYDISYNRFIRTSSAQHKVGAQELVRRLLASGHTYQSMYEGWYCTPCETFVAPSATMSTDTAQPCTSCGRSTAWMTEQTYFFKLSAFQEKLLNFYHHNPYFVTPKERFNEVISFVQEGLKDLSLSRKTVSWGVPFPGEPSDVIYVWVEALCGYLTAVGFGQKNNHNEFAHVWPADIQVLGKDIIRFHAIYWPAMLMAADLPLPKKLLVHGWIKVDKQKMSKSLGNVVDPMPLCMTYGPDAIRYFLCRQIPVNHDGEFSIADLEQHITADLANDLGNLLNRMVLLAEKYNLYEVAPITQWSAQAIDLRDQARTMIQDVIMHIDDCHIHLSLARIWKFINAVNLFFHEQAPWKIAKENREHFVEIISATAHSLKIIAFMLWPVMPRKMEELLVSLGKTLPAPGTNVIDALLVDVWDDSFLFKKGKPLFEKPELEQKESVEQEKPTVVSDQTITIDDLVKVILAIGTIIDAQKVPNYDKLLQFAVDLGAYGKRQILAGIAHYYKPEELIGKQATFVINLKPRKIAGIESQGMMLVAEDAQGTLQIIKPTNQVPNGARLR